MNPEAAETRVVIGLVRRGDTFLVGWRQAEPMAGAAEFPGGKVEPGETLEAALLREVREESGLEVAVDDWRREVRHTYPHGRLCLTFILCHPLNDAEPIAPFAWIPRQKLAALPFPGANEIVLRDLPP